MLAALVVSLALQAAPQPVQSIAREMMSRVDEPKQAVARTQAEWIALWRQHAGDTQAPAVDFSTRTVVAVFLGTRSTAGYTVDITGTRQASGVVTVEWRERRPDRDAITAQVLTSPMQAVTIPKFAGEIRFEKAER
jgi:hypothetical protein